MPLGSLIVQLICGAIEAMKLMTAQPIAGGLDLSLLEKAGIITITHLQTSLQPVIAGGKLTSPGCSYDVSVSSGLPAILNCQFQA